MMEFIQTVAVIYLTLVCTVTFFEIYSHIHPED